MLSAGRCVRVVTAPVRALALLLAGLAGACADEPPPPLTRAELQAMVHEVGPEVARLRGLEFSAPVPADLRSAEELAAYVRRRMEREFGSEAPLAYEAAVWHLLGLTEERLDMREVMESLAHYDVGGFYSPEEQAFYLIEGFNHGLLAELVMAHELCHALEDQHYDFESRLRPAELDTDRAFAQGAVLEGSASVLMYAYLTDVLSDRVRQMSRRQLRGLQSEMETFMSQASQRTGEVPAYLALTAALPYVEGAKFLSRAPLGLGRPSLADWNRVWEEPPLSSEQILHPEKYWEARKRDDPVPVDLPDLSAALGEGWKRVHGDVGGELTACFVTLESLPAASDSSDLVTGAWFNEASTGWGGDRLELYHGPAGEELLVWALVWDSHADREEFLDEFMTHHPARNPRFASAYASEDEGNETCLVFFGNAGGADSALTAREALLAERPDWH